MRHLIQDRNGNLRGSLLTEGDKTQLFAKNGELLGYSQYGKAFTKNGVPLGSADLLLTLLPA